MQIKSIQVKNFKSLVDFNLELAKFTCLIGLNGSGKSTVLQFIDFLAQQMRGKLDEWLTERDWKASELRSKLLSMRQNISFEVQIETKKSRTPGRWSAVFNPRQLRCTNEEIEIEGARLKVAEGTLLITTSVRSNTNGDEGAKSAISFKYQGSILSQLRENQLPSQLMQFREFIENIHSLDMLSPHYLRRRTRESAGSMGLGGQKLSAFLYELGNDKRRRLAKELKTVYPQLSGLLAKSLRSGWKQLEIVEDYEDEEDDLWGDQLISMTTEARHINEGMLRQIAILAELESEHSFVLFDEVENGVNPELIEFLLKQLLDTDKQVLVTTHSPLILNYLDDERAKKSVIYLYKTDEGYTKSIPFFSIPSLKKKLAVMGPGEAFADTSLVKLAKEIKSIPEPI